MAFKLADMLLGHYNDHFIITIRKIVSILSSKMNKSIKLEKKKGHQV